jgi:predicted PurR-regulated permease PerM
MLDKADSSGNERTSASRSDSQALWRRAGEISVIGLFIIATLWAIYAAQHVIVPVLLAWAIATIVLPVVKWMERSGVPRTLAAILVAVLFLALIGLLLLVLSAPLAYWLARASYVGALLREKLQSFSQPLSLLQDLQKGLHEIGSGSGPALKVEPQSTNIVTTIFSVATPVLSQFVLFVGALIFYLIYRQQFRNAVVLVLPERDARLATLKTLNEIEENMTTYFGTFTLINIGLGLVTGALTWFVGLPNPLLWGVLAGVLNFIPYLGPAIVIGTLAVVGLLVHPSLAEAAVAPLLFTAIVTVEGQFITPTILGRRLEINPFAVFLSIALCAWMWGPLGAFLAVPLLMVMAAIVSHAFIDNKTELPK